MKRERQEISEHKSMKRHNSAS